MVNWLCELDSDSDPVPGVYVVNDRYVHLQGYHFVMKEPGEPFLQVENANWPQKYATNVRLVTWNLRRDHSLVLN